MSYPNNPTVLPAVLVSACKSFEQFYLSQHSGRRLTWQPSLGNADVRVSFKARKHDLNVSTYALVILLLFEGIADGEFLTYEVQHVSKYHESGRAKSCVGNQAGNADRGQRAAAQSAVSRVRKVQGPQEAPRGTRREHKRLLLLQQ